MHPFYHHIARNNDADPNAYTPLMIAGRKLGLVHKKIAQALRATDFASFTDHAIVLKNDDSFEARNAALHNILQHLIADGLVRKERREMFAVAPSFDAEPVALADRSLMPILGFPAVGIHCNAYIRDPNSARAVVHGEAVNRANGENILLWTARRSMNSTTDPGKLDHLVAGGQPHGYSLRENLAKEAWEEAGVPEQLVGGAVDAGFVRYNKAEAHGIRRDTLYVFDLELPADFQPHSNDGESGEFRLMAISEILERLRGDDFKFNVPLVLIGFLIRHGFITADEPGFAELKAGLAPAAARY